MVVLFLNSAGASLEEATTESIHILLPPHEHGSTEVHADSIVHAPNGCVVDVVGIYTGFTWKNKAFGHGTHVPSGREREKGCHSSA